MVFGKPQTFRVDTVKRTFFLKAVWDEEARVFYSESDIEGFISRRPTWIPLKTLFSMPPSI
jgi:hypothetical protein